MKKLSKILIMLLLMCCSFQVVYATDGFINSFMAKEAIIGFFITAIVLIILFSILKKVIFLSVAIGLIVLALVFSYQNTKNEPSIDNIIEISSEESVQNE